MSPHTTERTIQRIPLTLYDGDILLLLRLKHKLENETKRPVQTSQILRLALRELAQRHDIIDNS